MNDSTFHILSVGSQVITLLILLFGAGKYIGKTNQLLNTLTANVVDIKTSLSEHEKEDSEKFGKIFDSLTDVKVNIAKQQK